VPVDTDHLWVINKETGGGTKRGGDAVGIAGKQTLKSGSLTNQKKKTTV